MTLDSSGRLVSRLPPAAGASTKTYKLEEKECAGGGRCINPGGGPAPLATRTSRQKAVLSSTIPDHFFEELKELVIAGTDNSSLTLQVAGIVRAPDPDAA